MQEHQYQHSVYSNSKELVRPQSEKQLLGRILASEEMMRNCSHFKETLMSTVIDEGAYNYIGYISRHVLKAKIEPFNPEIKSKNETASKYEAAFATNTSKKIENPERPSDLKSKRAYK